MPPRLRSERLTPEMMKAIQLNTEIGAYITSNWANAYDCFDALYAAIRAAAGEPPKEK